MTKTRLVIKRGLWLSLTTEQQRDVIRAAKLEDLRIHSHRQWGVVILEPKLVKSETYSESRGDEAIDDEASDGEIANVIPMVRRA